MQYTIIQCQKCKSTEVVAKRSEKSCIRWQKIIIIQYWKVNTKRRSWRYQQYSEEAIFCLTKKKRFASQVKSDWSFTLIVIAISTWQETIILGDDSALPFTAPQMITSLPDLVLHVTRYCCLLNIVLIYKLVTNRCEHCSFPMVIVFEEMRGTHISSSCHCNAHVDTAVDQASEQGFFVFSFAWQLEYLKKSCRINS